VLWLSNVAVSLSFAPLRIALGAWPVFALFTGVNIVGFVFVSFGVKETRFKKLEDVEIVEPDETGAAEDTETIINDTTPKEA
jgi:uncharacterized membrane protein